MTYYREFGRKTLNQLLRRVNTYLTRWSMKKYKKLRSWRKAIRAMAEAAGNRPRYFAHWAWVKPARQRTRTTRAV